jgi:ribosomal protein S18 acetylase RimI-like enzyme
MDVRIRAVLPGEWEKVRDLRLEALKDTPTAYVERYEDAVRLSADEWRIRAQRGAEGSKSTRWVAETQDGRWVGMMVGYVDASGVAWLVGVYVAPEFRGRSAGVADRLLDAIISWARDQANVKQLVLEVREDNEAAKRFYTRRGFTPTGNAKPYPLDPAYDEIELSLDL